MLPDDRTKKVSGKSLERVFSCVHRFQFRVFELSIYIATL